MKYYIILNDVQLGPLDIAELAKLPVTATTPVWTEGMADWMPAGRVPELAHLFGGAGQYSGPVPPPRQPQQQTQAPGMDTYSSDIAPECPDTYLVWSLLVTVFCCLPFGIVAIVKSSNVTSAYDRGNYDLAMSESKSAKTWIIVSVILGLVTCAVSAGLQFISLL